MLFLHKQGCVEYKHGNVELKGCWGEERRRALSDQDEFHTQSRPELPDIQVRFLRKLRVAALRDGAGGFAVGRDMGVITI